MKGVTILHSLCVGLLIISCWWKAGSRSMCGFQLAVSVCHDWADGWCKCKWGVKSPDERWGTWLRPVPAAHHSILPWHDLSRDATTVMGKKLPWQTWMIGCGKISFHSLDNVYTHTLWVSKKLSLHSCLKVKYSVRCRHSWLPLRRKRVVGWLIFRVHRKSTHCRCKQKKHVKKTHHTIAMLSYIPILFLTIALILQFLCVCIPFPRAQIMKIQVTENSKPTFLSVVRVVFEALN